MNTQGGTTFRDAINNNKKCVIEYLTANGESFTNSIEYGYKGEKGMPAVRKALNELRVEGKVTTDDTVYMWTGKKWKLT